MSDYNFDNFQDYDPIREAEEDYGRYNGNEYRPLRRSSAEQRRKARRRKRIIHRTIVLTAALLVLILIITLISSVFKSCSNTNENITQNETDEISGTSQPESSPEQTTESGTAEQLSLSSLDFVTPSVSDDGTSGSFSSNIYIYKNAGYLSFSGSAQEAQNYADAILSYKSSLPPSVNVYDMIVPSASEIRLPQRLNQEALGADSQADFIKTAYERLGSEVTAVNVYNTLSQHNDEYIYYNTDSHWTALGAYYGYAEFAAAAGFTPLDLSSMVKKSVSGFTGEYAVLTQNTQLTANPDTVDYYEYPEDVNLVCKMQTENGGELQQTTLYYGAASSGSLTYGVFLWSDQPLFVIETEHTTGKNILVVKDSFGNPLAPLLANDYDSVHIIDYRRWDGNLSSYCTENNITDVLFINEVANAARSSQIDTMDTLFN